jgi:hypothetical protein
MHILLIRFIISIRRMQTTSYLAQEHVDKILIEGQENPVRTVIITNSNVLMENVYHLRKRQQTLLGITGLPHATLRAAGDFLMLHLLCVHKRLS